MPPNWHPSDEQLTRFITVEDDSTEGKLVAEHIDQCEHCQERLENIDQAREIPRIQDEDLPTEVPLSMIENVSRAVHSDHLPVSYPALVGTQSLEFQAFFDKGGMGDVLVYKDRELDRNVILKTLRHDRSQSPQKRKRFSQEKRITSQLRLPGVPEVYGAGTLPDGREYFCMQFIEGGKLSEHIAEFHKGDPKLVRSNESFLSLLRIFITICRTLESAHQQKIVHRDLKSSNVLLGKNNFPFVIDWGLARDLASDQTSIQNDESQDSARLSKLGLRIGTPYSWSPEQAAGQIDIIDSLTDVYGLGSILFEILTGLYLHAKVSTKNSSSELESKSPVEERSEIERITAELLSGVVRDPRSINSSIPSELASICIKATQHRRENRYQSAGQLADDLDSWIACLPVKAHRYNSRERFQRWIVASPSRAATTLIGIFLIGLIAVVFSSVTYALKKKAQDNEQRAQAAVRNGLTTLRSVINIANDNRRPDTDELRDIQQEMVAAIEAGIKNTTSIAFDGATRIETAILLGKLGDIHSENSQDQEALRVYLDAIQLFDARPSIDIQKDFDARILYAELQCSLAVGYIACKQRDEATKTVAIALECIQEIPENELASRNKLSLSLYVRRMFAIALFRNWDRNTLNAHDVARESLPYCNDLLSRWPDNDHLKLEKAELLSFIGLCVHKSGSFQGEMLRRYAGCSTDSDLVGVAQTYFTEALSILETVNNQTKSEDSFLKARVSILQNRALSDARISQAKSRDTYEQCLDTLRKFVEKYPFSRERRLDLAATLSEFADQHYPERITRAIELRRESLALLSEFINSESPRFRNILTHVAVRHARDLAITNQRPEAKKLVTEIYKRYHTLHHGLPLQSEFLGYALILSEDSEGVTFEQRDNLPKLAAEYLKQFDSASILSAKDLLHWLKTDSDCQSLARQPVVRSVLESLQVSQ